MKKVLSIWNYLVGLAICSGAVGCANGDDSGASNTTRNTGGEDLHRESPFHNNMVPRWLTNTPVDFAFGANAVKAPSREVQVLP